MGRFEGIGSVGAATLGGGDERVRIAVLDGPIDLDHPCFLGARIETLENARRSGGTGADIAHGTHVASIIFGRKGGDVEGLASACHGLSIPIFGERDGVLDCSQLELARAILVAIEHGAQLINVSGGQLCDEAQADAYLRDALAKAEMAGVLVIAAAGNDGCDCVHMPAAAPTVLAVGAAGLDGRPLEFSNWGATYGLNGILAPGENIEGALPGGGTTRRTGSSFATPIVTGFAALLLADQLRDGQAPNPLAVRDAILSTAIRCAPDDAEQRCLAGRLNIAGSIKKIRNGRQDMSEPTVLDDLAYAVHQAPRVQPGAQVRAAGHTADAASPDAARRSPNGGAVGPSDCGCGCGGDKKDCGCGGGGQPSVPQKVFAIGKIDFDFGSEARRDSIQQFLPHDDPDSPPPPINASTLLGLLAPNGDVLPEVERITWVLKVDQTPIYAIRPSGAFAFNGYALILSAFAAQNNISWPSPPSPEPKKKGKDVDEVEKEKSTIDLFSIAGVIAGEVRLMSGETVPVLVPSARGIISWDLDKALEDFKEKLKAHPRPGAAQTLLSTDADSFDAEFGGRMNDFKSLVLGKYRNLGILGSDRALNFAATMAKSVFDFLFEMVGLSLVMEDIWVVTSPACRPGSECYDVRIRAFRASDVTAALRTFQFTVDVSDTMPVNIGRVSSWSERPSR